MDHFFKNLLTHIIQLTLAHHKKGFCNEEQGELFKFVVLVDAE